MKSMDMTRGAIMENILRFALPIIAGNILQYLYTTVDTLVIGNYCDHTAIAAVGTSAQPIEILLCLFLGIGTGVTILVSQQIGAKNREALRNICRTAASLVYLFGIPVGILGWFASPYLLQMMNVPSDVFSEALLYTRIVLAAGLGNIGYNMNAGILRGAGDSRASLYFLVVSCITNVILDITLVAGLGMGVAGAAAATGAAMYMAWFFSMFYLLKRYPDLGFTILPERLSAKEVKAILSIGLPIGFNNSLFSFGHAALQTLINLQGSFFMAAWSISGRVNGIANMAITGISSAATTFSGQNYGAGRIDRLRRGQSIIPAANGAITLTFGLVFIAMRMPILRLFTSDPGILTLSGRFAAIMLASQWMYAVFNGISCIVNGTGRVRYTTMVNLLMLWAVRVPAAYLLASYAGGNAIPYSFPISFAFGMISMIAYCLFSSSWKELMRRGEEQELHVCSA